MAIEWNGETVKRAAKEEAAKRLQRTAIWFWRAHIRKLSVSNPRPYLDSSLPGEYPRKRTGGGIGNVIWGPDTLAGIITEGLKVRIGIMEPGKHLLILELAKHRLGFLKTLNDNRDLLKAMLEAKAS